VYGNVTESDALSLFAIAEDTFLSPTSTPLPPRPQWPIVKLNSEEEVVLRTALHNKDETNHGIQVERLETGEKGRPYTKTQRDERQGRRAQRRSLVMYGIIQI
jgi:hypothetical protein